MTTAKITTNKNTLDPKLARRFPYIVAWCTMLNSPTFYVRTVLAMAQRTSAPKTAIFHDVQENRWWKFDELKSEYTQQKLNEIIEVNNEPTE